MSTTSPPVNTAVNSTILITGAAGQLGSYLLRESSRRGLTVVAWTHRQRGTLFDHPLHPVAMEDDRALAQSFAESKPAVVIHTAAIASIAACYKDSAGAELINHRAVKVIARLCRDSGARLIQVSTDLVFNGSRAPYREADPASPLSIYGRTKASAEQAALTAPGSGVIRLSLMYGPTLVDRPVIFDQLLSALRHGEPFASLFSDEYRTPLSLEVAAQALLDLVGVAWTGILHLGGPERMSRLEFGRRLARYLGVDEELVQSASRLDGAPAEARPEDVSLDSSRFKAMMPEFRFPTLEESFADMGIAPTHPVL